MVNEVAKESPGIALMRRKAKIKKILPALLNLYMDRFK
jgi:hypothetical protein